MDTADVQQDFETILRETHARVRAYCAGMGVAAHEVDDLAQDVYLELYKNFDKIPEGVEPLRWLKGIARNLCLNHFRRSSRRSRLQREALAEILARTDVKTEVPIREGTLQNALDQCLEKLPEKSRRLVKLRYADELTSDAIAKTTNSTAEAIRVALFRIRATLKDCITNTVATIRPR
jgi:RNA polymerase sigma-70 factor (ECF subfamily)